jgi:hypothetical protein
LGIGILEFLELAEVLEEMAGLFLAVLVIDVEIDVAGSSQRLYWRWPIIAGATLPLAGRLASVLFITVA